MGQSGLAQMGTFAVKFIGQALEEQHAENEFLELARVHLAAQDVGSLEEEVFRVGKA
ncbi:hypothetical protein SAMN05421754_10555 [Nitrosomonas sp. Nm58]|nr:hypothetical protein SAMN05421754_10555 [Nitrosomonas sp. Nm58]